MLAFETPIERSRWFWFAMAQVIPAAWLRLFNPAEVNELLSGGASGGADAEDMRAHATYSGGYSDSSRTIALFWQVRLVLRTNSIFVPAPPLAAHQHRLFGVGGWQSGQCRQVHDVPRVSQQCRSSDISDGHVHGPTVLHPAVWDHIICLRARTGRGRVQQRAEAGTAQVHDLLQPRAAWGLQTSRAAAVHTQGMVPAASA